MFMAGVAAAAAAIVAALVASGNFVESSCSRLGRSGSWRLCRTVWTMFFILSIDRIPCVVICIDLFHCRNNGQF